MNRGLSPCERFYWYANAYSPGNVTAVAHVSGPIEIDLLRRAASHLGHLHPLLGVHVVEEPGGSLWFVSDGTDAPHVRIESSEQAVQGVIESELNEGVGEETAAPACGPLFRCRVVAGAERGEWVALLTALHMVSDASSTLLALRDWLDCYARLLEDRELPSTRQPERAAFDELLPRTFGQRLRPYIQSARFIGRVGARRRRHTLRLNAQQGVALRARNSVVVHHSFRASEMAALQRNCRAAGVTLHGAFMAALAVAMRDVLGQPGTAASLVELATPTSLRHLYDAPIGEEVGCYVSMLHAFLSVRPEASFWELAREANRVVQESLAREEHWAALTVGGLMAPKTRAQAATMFDKVHMESGFGACISNVGKFELPAAYGGVQVHRAYCFGALSFSGLLCVGVLTCRGRTEICSSYAAGTVTQSTVTGLLNRFCAELSKHGASDTGESDVRSAWLHHAMEGVVDQARR